MLPPSTKPTHTTATPRHTTTWLLLAALLLSIVGGMSAWAAPNASAQAISDTAPGAQNNANSRQFDARQYEDGIRDFAQGNMTQNARDFLEALGGGQNLNELGIRQLDQALQDVADTTLGEVANNGNVLDMLDNSRTDIGRSLANQLRGNAADIGGLFEGKTLVSTVDSRNLLASVMFSESSTNQLDELNLPVSRLEQYPAPPERDKNRKYGELVSPTPDSPPTDRGIAISTLVRGLYENEWLATTTNENSLSSRVARFLPGGEKAPADVVATSSLWLSSGATGLYSAGTGLIDVLSTVTRSINIPHIINLAVADDTGELTGITAIVANVVNAMGLTGATITAIRFLAVGIIGSLLLIVIMATLRSINQSGRVRDSRGVRNWGSRLMVIVLTVPFGMMITEIMDTMTTGVENQAKSAGATVNGDYFVDTLAWAATNNLSMGAGQVGAGDFDPTLDNVRKINSQIDQELLSTKSPNDQMSDFLRGERSSALDYFNTISNYAYTNSAAPQFFQPQGSTGYLKTDENRTIGRATTVPQPYFLSENPPSTVGDSEQSSSSNDNAETDGAANEGGQNTIVIGGQQFVVGTQNAMRATAVAWNAPHTYLYGAVGSGGVSAEQADIDNFIFGKDSKQNWDVENSTPNSDMVESKAAAPAGAGDNGIGTSVDDRKAAMDGNAASIAQLNAWGGTNSAPDALSTQSVAFLLQSTFYNDTLNYKGYMTAPSAFGTGANRGVNGNQFFRYTIPSASKADLDRKVASLTVTWLCMGIITILVAFAILKSPLFLGILNMFKGFFGALFTGNLAALLNYGLYFIAMRLSFLFAAAAIVLAGSIVTMLTQLLNIDGFYSRANDLANTAGAIPIPGLGAFANGLLVVVSLAITAAFVFVVGFPLFRITNGAGQQEKASIITIVTTLPYLLADMFSHNLNQLNAIVGQSGGQARAATGGSAAGARLHNIATGGAQLAASAVTGGVAGVATSAGSKLLSKVGQSGAEGAEGAAGDGVQTNSPQADQIADDAAQGAIRANQDAQFNAPRGGGPDTMQDGAQGTGGSTRMDNRAGAGVGAAAGPGNVTGDVNQHGDQNVDSNTGESKIDNATIENADMDGTTVGDNTTEDTSGANIESRGDVNTDGGVDNVDAAGGVQRLDNTGDVNATGDTGTVNASRGVEATELHSDTTNGDTTIDKIGDAVKTAAAGAVGGAVAGLGDGDGTSSAERAKERRDLERTLRRTSGDGADAWSDRDLHVKDSTVDIDGSNQVAAPRGGKPDTTPANAPADKKDPNQAKIEQEARRRKMNAKQGRRALTRIPLDGGADLEKWIKENVDANRRQAGKLEKIWKDDKAHKVNYGRGSSVAQTDRDRYGKKVMRDIDRQAKRTNRKVRNTMTEMTRNSRGTSRRIDPDNRNNR